MCFPGGSNGKESACNVGDLGSTHGVGKSPREGNGKPCLENPHGKKSLVGYTVHGVAKSLTQPSD